MTFRYYFRASSYAMIAIATLALVLAGGLHLLLAGAFLILLLVAWKIEGTQWQLSERVGLAAVLLALPLFYLDWKFFSTLQTGERENPGVGALAHLIVFLAAVKLLQVKSDRDWVFLYLISFFEVLLAAGLSLSPVFLVTLAVYLLCGLNSVIAFEIRKAKRNLRVTETRLLVPPDSSAFRHLTRQGKRKRHIETRRLPIVALVLLGLIFALALPLFLVAPRTGSSAISRGGAGLTNLIGFSESVALGQLGSLKRNDQVVMHVRIEEPAAENDRDLRWRGVALDEFTGRGWRKSIEARRFEQKTSDKGFFQLGATEALHHLATQTIFLEPIDTPVLFTAPRVVALQGPFPFIRVDGEGSIQSRYHDLDRLIYKAFSDTSEPDPDPLRRDSEPYPLTFARYLQLPPAVDERIGNLARAMIVNAHAGNRYDVAKAIESQLRSDYGYTLELKAGGEDPLADFLFNVRAGHCEYFSTSMAVMLRTQGIAARVVNGFLTGEYNDAAGAYTVRESDAHSWVEVYFPETNSWVTFDPTPAAGKNEPQRAGLAARLGKYAEALDLFWVQYVVGYDKQEQRSLATSLHNRLFDYRRAIPEELAELERTYPRLWRKVVLVAIALPIIVVLGLLLRRVKRLGWRRGLGIRVDESVGTRSAVEFYERLTMLLAARGITRAPDQTPLEFATGVGMSEVVHITQAYNNVRYGDQTLSASELKRIEEILSGLEREQIRTP